MNIPVDILCKSVKIVINDGVILFQFLGTQIHLAGAGIEVNKIGRHVSVQEETCKSKGFLQFLCRILFLYDILDVKSRTVDTNRRTVFLSFNMAAVMYPVVSMLRHDAVFRIVFHAFRML